MVVLRDVGAGEAMAAVSRVRARQEAWASWLFEDRRAWGARLLRAAHRERKRLAGLACRDCGLSAEEATEDWASLPARRVSRTLGAHPAEPGSQVIVGLTDRAAPLSSLFGSVLPALLAGQGVVTALDPVTADIADRVHGLARREGLPDGVWELLVGQAAYTCGVLPEHADASRVACCVPRTAPHSCTRPALLVVRHDAHVPTAVRGALRSCLRGAGRSCTATQLLMVHERHHDAFLALFTSAARRLAHAPSPAHAPCPAHAPRPVHAFVRDECRLFGAVCAYEGGQESHGAAHRWAPAVVSQPDSDRIDPARVPPGPLAVISSYRSWSQALHFARRCGRHVVVHTASPVSRLAPQFATRPDSDLRLVRHLRFPWAT
ncbi:aldehyde dehydrogenase family protein [Streptomyces aureocirculatus]|uniref:aldehyde dehydrogenase family protein n=1 Tax=Streptomyces aureocirculatus TaxID=67275 RepID=UPI0004CBD293|nr:aldehyde dehydrogenase family protein [Streptomyces aureocirculatus]